MKSERNTFFDVVLIAVAILFLFVCAGCSDSVENGNTCGYITFSENCVSRGLSDSKEGMWRVSDLYWTYTARKTDGLYSEGESLLITEVGYNPGSGDTVYVERPVKDGPETGFAGVSIGPFATGTWEIKLYGYLYCTIESGKAKFKGLVYEGKPDGSIEILKGVTDPVLIKLNPPETADPDVPVTGKLKFGQMKITVPESMCFYSGGEVKVKIFREDTGVLVAESCTPVITDLTAGNSLTLYNVAYSTDASGNPLDTFDAGSYNLTFIAQYKDSHTVTRAGDGQEYNYAGSSFEGKIDNGYALVGEIKIHPIVIISAKSTVVQGDINDIVEAVDKNRHGVGYDFAVAKILKTGKSSSDTDGYDLYTTFADAVDDYGDNNHKDGSGNANPVIVVYDIENCGEFTLGDTDVVVKLTDDGNNYHFINNLTVTDGSTKGFVFKLEKSGASERTYRFTKGKVTGLSYNDDTVWLVTQNGNLEVNADDNVYHTGTVGKVTLNKVKKDNATPSVPSKGYHLGTVKEGSSAVTSVSELTISAGSLELGGRVAVETLKVTGDSDAVTVRGMSDSYVGNINKLRDNDSGFVNNTNRSVFKKVIIKANGGTPTADKTLYGIEGMKMNVAEASFTSFPFTAPEGQFFVGWNTDSGRVGEYHNESVTVSASDVTLYALWGFPIAKILSDDGSNYGYFQDLETACKAFGVGSYSSGEPIMLLSDIDGETIDTVTNPAVKKKICPNGYKISNAVVSGTNDFSVVITSDRVYSITRGGTVDFSYVGNDVKVKTSGTDAEITINAAEDNVTHTGVVKKVTLTTVQNEHGKNRGYHLNVSSNVTEVVVNKGFLDIGAGVGIGTLKVKATSANLVYLKGTQTSTVTKMCSGSSDTELRLHSGSASNDSSKAYKVINVYGHGAKVTGASSLSQWRMYGIEGMKAVLPKYSDSTRTPVTLFDVPVAPTGLGHVEFVLWNSSSDCLGDVVSDGKTIVVGNGETNIYAMWGSKCAGQLAFIDERSGYDSYRFYTKSGDTFTVYDRPITSGKDITDMYYVYMTESLPSKDRYYVYDGNYVSSKKYNTADETSEDPYVGVDGWTRAESDGNEGIGGVVFQTAFIGKGKADTLLILNSGETRLTEATAWQALKSRNASKTKGVDDWFLPSVGELYQLIIGRPNMFTDGRKYFSSTLYGTSGLRNRACVAWWSGNYAWSYGFMGASSQSDRGYCFIRSF